MEKPVWWSTLVKFTPLIKRLGGTHGWHDLFQSVSTRLWQRYKDRELGEPLIVTVIRNAARDAVRQKARQPEFVSLTMAEHVEPVRRSSVRENDIAFPPACHALIQMIVEDSGSILHMRYVERLSYDQISDRTGLSFSNVRRAIRSERARAHRLREQNAAS